MDAVDDLLVLCDELNPKEWSELDYDQQKRRLEDLNGLQGATEGVLSRLDRVIREHELDEDHVNYLRHLEDKSILVSRQTRLQRMCTQLQTLMKTP